MLAVPAEVSFFTENPHCTFVDTFSVHMSVLHKQEVYILIL